jgi:hypothetical protein
MSAFELVKLALFLSPVVWWLSREQHAWVLGFMGFSLGTEIFVVDLGPTITGLQLVGLVHLFYLPRVLGIVSRTMAGRTLLFGLALLAALAVVYGYLLPWHDHTGERPWTQRAEGRSVINLSATLSYVSAAMYVAARMQEAKYRRRIIDFLLIGTTVASVGVLLEVATKVDFYALLGPTSGDWSLGEGGRARGFNGEPRVSGSLAATGIIMLLRPGFLQSPKAVLLLFIHALGMAFTTSTLALILLLCGTGCLLVLTGRVAVLAIAGVAGALTVLFISAWFGSSPLQLWMEYTGERISTRQEAIGERLLIDSLVQVLEVFDASALNFLYHNPQHLFVGVGPGLVSLPASHYVPPGDAQAIFGDRIDSIPFMGLLRTVSDSGLVGLVLWCWTAVAMAGALHRCTQLDTDDSTWRTCRTYYLVFAALFLLQLRPTWYVWLGVGLGAAVRVQRATEKAVTEARALRRAQTPRRSWPAKVARSR